jgi:hypothetical protein
MMSRRAVVISLILGVFILIPLILWGISIGQNRSSGDGVIRDRDTGEVYNENVNSIQTGGSGVTTGSTQLFGIEPFAERLINEGKSVSYVDSLRQALWGFSNDRLNNEFESITLRPQGLEIRSDVSTGSIRLGQTDTVIPISIHPSRSGAAAIITINQDSDTYDGTYIYVGGIKSPQNLLFTIEQKNTTSSDLIIRTYEGYREVALEYIESIGYNVPDFRIEFTNYENPFL